MGFHGGRYCGREFSADDMEVIRAIIRDRERHPSRAAVARAACEALSWRTPGGELKEMSARVALLRMHRDGSLELPPPIHGYTTGGRRTPKITSASDPGAPVHGTRGDLRALCLQHVQGRDSSRLWNELIGRWHYLGYYPLPGAQMRYFIVDGSRLLGAIGLSAAAWKVAPRDDFIGWEPQVREARLHLVVNQSRFLILPWVKVRYLASSVLALMARMVGGDWEERYGYRPVLLETFVERDRFVGTCYRAANWIHVGETAGRGKIDLGGPRNVPALPVKDVFLYPLGKDFRERLGGG